MPSQLRMKRINDRIKEDLSEILIKEIADPRLNGVYITDVNVDRELAFANIYVSAVEGITRSKEIIEGLNHAKNFLRRNLAERIQLRIFPQLRFYWDPTPEKADHIEKLLSQIREESESKQE